MFDPDFVSNETGESVRSIDADITITAMRNLLEPAGAVEVTSSFVVFVLWAAETGARSDVRLVHVLTPDDSGFWRIREQHELPALGAMRVEDVSWGAMKNLYR